ncbi:hypothetical protein WJ03_23825 [Burkholderia vietnamiensis]|nr:hypothetical protein WJ03_23825 [Burkholderia vietnamiensis]
MACISLNHHEAEKVAMQTRFSLSCVRLAIAFALACPFTSVCAQQRALPERAVPAGNGLPRLRHDGGGFLLVAAVEARSTDALSVTLWDELARPKPPPAPLPRPVDTQHAMAGGTTHRTHQ